MLGSTGPLSGGCCSMSPPCRFRNNKLGAEGGAAVGRALGRLPALRMLNLWCEYDAQPVVRITCGANNLWCEYIRSGYIWREYPPVHRGLLHNVTQSMLSCAFRHRGCSTCGVCAGCGRTYRQTAGFVAPCIGTEPRRAGGTTDPVCVRGLVENTSVSR